MEKWWLTIASEYYEQQYWTNGYVKMTFTQRQMAKAGINGPADKVRTGDKVPMIAAIVLAAGCSQRMGDTNKLLAHVDGKPMVRWVVEAAVQSQVQTTVVVTGFEADEVMDCLSELAVDTVFNPNYAMGMAGSLRAGIESLGPVDGALILLADMPLLRADHLDALIAGFDLRCPDSVVVPVCDGRRGNPVLWPVQYFSLLCELDGDVGARKLLEKLVCHWREVALRTEAFFVDVDTPEMLSWVRRP